MAKPKRMSEIFTSSTDKNASTALPATAAAASPPYSSEGPTLPIVGSAKKQQNSTADTKVSKKRKAVDQNPTTTPPPSVHPSLYTPWILLPAEPFKLLQTQDRLRGTQNVVPVVFTKNQNVKTGINRLKMLLGASPNTASTIEIKDAMKQNDLTVAVSAQGDGTTKLVGIVDMARRIVAPTKSSGTSAKEPDTWWMYTILTSIVTERRAKNKESVAEDTQVTQDTQEEDEDEAFEPMDIDGQEEETNEKIVETRKVPVLTVWMTKTRIPEFCHAFGEESFQVQGVED